MHNFCNKENIYITQNYLFGKEMAKRQERKAKWLFSRQGTCE